MPDKWHNDGPTRVKWAGKFVSPKDGPVYLSASIRSDKMVGYSTWFAFWLFTQTRAYNDKQREMSRVLVDYVRVYRKQ